jgi:hypothetical protein
MRLLLGLTLALTACGRPDLPAPRLDDDRMPLATDAGAQQVADAGLIVDAGAPIDAGVPLDAGSPDAGPSLSWARDVRPILEPRCSRCHESNNVPGLSFGDTYDVFLQPSTRCPGTTVGACVAQALALQRTEGRWCRTYETPFHREGWNCLPQAEIDLVTRWVNAGMPR